VKVDIFLNEGEEYPQLISVWRLDQKTGRADLTTRRNYVDDRNGWDQWCKTDDENIRLRAENAKLRKQIHWLKQGDILHVLTDQEYIDQCERERLMQVSIDALDKDNTKLRELARFIMHQCNDGNPRCDECINWNGGECVALQCMRELGVTDG